MDQVQATLRSLTLLLLICFNFECLCNSKFPFGCAQLLELYISFARPAFALALEAIAIAEEANKAILSDFFIYKIPPEYEICV